MSVSTHVFPFLLSFLDMRSYTNVLCRCAWLAPLAPSVRVLSGLCSHLEAWPGRVSSLLVWLPASELLTPGPQFLAGAELMPPPAPASVRCGCLASSEPGESSQEDVTVLLIPLLCILLVRISFQVRPTPEGRVHEGA